MSRPLYPNLPHNKKVEIIEAIAASEGKLKPIFDQEPIKKVVFSSKRKKGK